MARRRLILGLVPGLFGATVLGGACTDEAVEVGLVMHSPQGLLDTATSVQLSVFDAAGATCNADGTTVVPDDAQRFELSNQGCSQGVGWCGEITLDRDGSTKMFAVIASNAAGIVAQGCAPAAILQDPVVVEITVIRYVEPECCNDGILQPTETCDTGVPADTDCAGGPGGVCVAQVPTEMCECNCETREIAMDRPLNQPELPNAQRFADVALAFAPGNSFTQNGLRGVFVDREASGGSDLFLRILNSELGSICPTTDACNAAGEPPLPLGGPLELPVACSPTTGINQKQVAPAIASVSPDATAIVFASDAAQANVFNITLNHQTSDNCAEAPGILGGIQVNQQNGNCANPAIATGPSQIALVVWEQGGQILARTWEAATGTLGNEVTIATGGSAPRVAGSPDGWIVVYQGGGGGDPDAIIKKRIDLAATVGPEERVNTVTAGLQDLPDVAMFPDGRHAVVWHSATDVFFQRFAADGTSLAGDQDAPIHVMSDGEQLAPAVAASVGLGNFYAVAWVHVDSGHVHARYLGANGGFQFNNVDGQNGDFIASSLQTVGARRNPTIAIGGGGFVAMGWHDDSVEHPGVFVRRFPLPPE